MAAIDLRYARALAAVVSEQNLDLQGTRQQLEDFADTLEASAELREVLHNPSLPEAQKLALLDAISARAGLSVPVRNFIALLARHERLQELREMMASFDALADDKSDIAEAEIVSAAPLDETSRGLLEKTVAQLSGGRQVRARYSQDASLLGGAIVRLGSTVYDGSVRAQLEQLRRRLAGAR